MKRKRNIFFAVSLTFLAVVCLGFAKPSRTPKPNESFSRVRVENNVLRVEGLRSTATYIVLTQTGNKINGLMFTPGKASISIPVSRSSGDADYEVMELRYIGGSRCRPNQAGCPRVRCPGCSFDLQQSGLRLP
jgi:hypothetical protein